MNDFTIIDKAFNKSFTPLKDERLESIPEEKHPYHRFLYHLVKDLKVEFALEIGTWHGVGSYHMARAGAAVAAVDINIPKYSDKFYFYHGDSCSKDMIDKIKDFVGINGNFNLVFQDSSHHYIPSHTEFAIYSHMCAPGAIWICDDCQEIFHDPKVDPKGKSLLDYFNEIPVANKRLYNDLHPGNQIGVCLL